MKKTIIVLLAFFVLFFGAVIFFCVYNYDKIHFGDELLMYSDHKAEGYPVTISYEEENYDITGYEKTELYRIIIRGQGTRKRHLFPVKCSAEPYVITFGEEYRISVYQSDDGTDTAYYRYENLKRHSKKHYTVSNMKTWDHLTAFLFDEEEK